MITFDRDSSTYLDDFRVVLGFVHDILLMDAVSIYVQCKKGFDKKVVLDGQSTGPLNAIGSGMRGRYEV